MHDFENTTGFYMWTRAIRDESYIHPEDIGRFRRLMADQEVFECVEQSGEYLVLRHDTEEYRVKPDLYAQIQDLPFRYGDTVETVTGTKRVGMIREIIWHSKKRAPMYFIRVGGKKISKRYWEEDLVLVRRAGE